jgi:parallel beta-helix repeat protein
LIQTSDGGYALAGSAASRSPGDSDFWLLKINPEGNVQWTKTFGGLDDDNANSVVQSSDGGYVLAGSTNSFGAGGSDAWLVKTDSMGNLMWTRTYGGVGWLNALNGVPVDSAVGSDGSGDDSANCVIQTSDGGLAFTGATPFHVEWSSSFVWLVKTDSSGNIQWNQTYSTYSSEQRGIEASSINTWSGNSLIETSKGAFAIAGYAQQGGFPYLNGAYYLVKTQPALPPPSESPSPNPSSTPSTSPKPSPILEFPPTTISADGDVNPSTAPIQRNGNVYTFTGNLNGPLVVKRDNIVIDGAAYSLQGNGTAGNLFIRMTKTGIDLAGRTNVTVKNLQVYSYKNGIYLNGATNVTISGNNIAQNGNGVFETNSAHATISENNITQNNDGVFVTSTSSNNNITNNNIVSNPDTGITLNQSVGNVIFGNNISNNGNGGGDGLSGIFLDSGLNNLIAGNILYGDRYGISMGGSTGAIIAANNITGCSFGVIATDASGNVFCMNDFNNTHINEFSGEGSNSWDNGTVGNYWSDYTTRYPNAKELDSSGIGDTPYFMVYGYTPSTPNDPNTPNPNNVDLHPLMAPISSASAAALAQALVLAHSWSPTSTQSPSTNLILFASLALVAVVIVLVAVVVLKCRKKQIQATLSAPS